MVTGSWLLMKIQLLANHPQLRRRKPVDSTNVLVLRHRLLPVRRLDRSPAEHPPPPHGHTSRRLEKHQALHGREVQGRRRGGADTAAEISGFWLAGEYHVFDVQRFDDGAGDVSAGVDSDNKGTAADGELV
ncbi:hypothetical protein LTR91_008059 [Friedmanniomyces endolithicus]|uniref:Uncharacterized protein n=1 Tax=Friedmanniomyces endolithicus TaxID=329885 RepID=A0AAN6QUX7_9PEZI|nr:hypothetical protein LTR35_003402 [Friedmanniomyces endolithicus]KAK0293197.1 hypothetical protein LTS00_007800 [Friedmanniomyces endolithicus]KAK0319532.1 hypothetical protein LTR82_009599 [Friedmanniomyces endolithicus]KAK0984853.1 hypothetical protein LTR54_013973 [Friedmanniomyces endolithicus]KAK0992405.1 hypothetical protein LTS01_007800 [Friedmanniomyces endolithicus]